MKQLSDTIPKAPVLKPAEDYYRLRREGIGFIEQMGSSLWTDYNTHDPGITILEALCFAITDFAYRTGWDMKDLLASPPPLEDPNNPYPNQPFFTARKILTVNPWTPGDFRRLLIDLDLVRNAWVFCKECACDVLYYAWCEENELRLSYHKPDKPSLEYKKVEPLGLYDVLLELDVDAELGDLNDRKIVQKFTLFDETNGTSHPLTLELRFPTRKLQNPSEYEKFVDSSHAIEKVIMKRFTPNKSDGDVIVGEDVLKKGWRSIFYISLDVTLDGVDDPLVQIHNATLRLFGDPVVQDLLKVQEQSASEAQHSLQKYLENSTKTGFVHQYGRKLVAVKTQMEKAKEVLHSHRNLDEDYCHIRGVDVEDVAVCADVEVAPDADIEQVQAQIWFEIEQYFNPPIPFHTLKELMDEGVPVEEIFKGPKLNNGFIKGEALEDAWLKTVLRTSDIINRLMDLEGVMAVNNLSLSKYDGEGNIIKGAADPKWESETPLFDPNKISASWVMFVTPFHQPRLYQNQSRFLFYKNGLPFLPRMDEAFDTLTQLRGEAERPKLKSSPNDLPVPKGTFRTPEEYSPVQYSFPIAYGIGPEGLPSHASLERRGQAKQLKAYLMVFEQLLGNAFAQLAGIEKLFSLDPKVQRTYFVREFKEELLNGYADITKGLDKVTVENLTETVPEFLERRNRFLDHLMARFGEQFGEYALMLTNWQGRQVALDRLIEDKISFLKAYPLISHDRAKAVNYRMNPCSPDNISGLKKRVSLLLGHPDLTFNWMPSVADPVVPHYELKDGNGLIWMEGDLPINITNGSTEHVKQSAFRAIIVPMSQQNSYEIAPENVAFRVKLKASSGDPIGHCPKLFQTTDEAQACVNELVGWSSNERVIVVEHLLLRPKFPGDALYPVCTDGPCKTSGEEDPYSFRLTFVMPGWTAPFNTNLEMRGFADRTIRQETPSHLLGKICWVGNDELPPPNGRQFDRFEEAWCEWLEANANFDWTEERLQERVEAILASNVVPASGSKAPQKDELCKCAAAILTGYGMNFYDWMEAHFNAGKAIEEVGEFRPDPVQLCTDFAFDPGTQTKIQTLLDSRYNEYKKVSYHLWMVVHRLAELRNTYPVATLHDCDDGSDFNPVRLGQTALGNVTPPPTTSPSDSSTLGGNPQPGPISEQPAGLNRTRRAKGRPVKPREASKRRKPKSSS